MIRQTLLSVLFLGIAVSGGQALAAPYTEALYLCDLGVRNTQAPIGRGVDYISFLRDGSRERVVAAATYSSARGQRGDLYNPWDPNQVLSDVSVNLDSDYYGAEYYFELCYQWHRADSKDLTEYNVILSMSIDQAVTNTSSSWKTSCTVTDPTGTSAPKDTNGAATVSTTAKAGQSDVRCSIRFTFTEKTNGTPRPHGLSVDGVSPLVTTRVES